ncbi:unnamed protein product [Polarella glacialis]|uniref:Protein C10 n=1 Tax=Polarella glacialis TaxID=89957 RepID=A0A813HIQ1_POLGL|nr:unnamed protein product [Polarella glacialis]
MAFRSFVLLVSGLQLQQVLSNVGVDSDKMAEVMEGLDDSKREEMMAMMGMGSGMGGGMGGMPGMGGMGGMEDMMGGMGGGMGGPPKPPPHPQIGVKTARKFMKEVLATLQPASEELAKAREGTEPGSQEMMEVVGPIMDRVLSSVVEKYKFQRGFSEGMASVQEAGKRKDCPKIKAMMHELTVLVTGQVVEDDQEKENEDL